MRWTAAIEELERGLLQRDVAARALLLAVLSGEHVLLLGPPGTAKSELARRLKRLLPGAHYFERLLTRFSVPEELFGPLSLKALEDDRYERLTDGYLPSAEVAFLDEVFKANSAILNTLLGLLHERRFDNGSQRVPVPLVCLVGASNEVPQDDGLQAFHDRFLLRVPVQPVDDDHFKELLQARWSESNLDAQAQIPPEVLSVLRAHATEVALGEAALSVLQAARAQARLTRQTVSDRRWRQTAALLQVQAASRGAVEVSPWDAWLLPFTLASDPAEVPGWVDWFLVTVAHTTPLVIDGLERATEAFEQQLDIERRAPTDVQDGDAGKLALARAMAGPVNESELVRITSERARRRYSERHVGARLEQLAELQLRVGAVQAVTQAKGALVLDEARAHAWLPPSWLRRIETAHTHRCAQIDTLVTRLAAVHEGFFSLPRRDDGDTAQDLPTPVSWQA
jgi:MoxR-like ATPase